MVWKYICSVKSGLPLCYGNFHLFSTRISYMGEAQVCWGTVTGGWGRFLSSKGNSWPRWSKSAPNNLTRQRSPGWVPQLVEPFWCPEHQKAGGSTPSHLLTLRVLCQVRVRMGGNQLMISSHSFLSLQISKHSRVRIKNTKLSADRIGWVVTRPPASMTPKLAWGVYVFPENTPRQKHGQTSLKASWQIGKLVDYTSELFLNDNCY